MPELSEELLERIARRFKAMSNAYRLKILHCLEDGELPVKEIMSRTGGSQANVSKHLNVLRSAGLVTFRRGGTNAYYRICDDLVFAICRSVCDSLLEDASAELETVAAGRASMMAGRR